MYNVTACKIGSMASIIIGLWRYLVAIDLRLTGDSSLDIQNQYLYPFIGVGNM